MGNRLPARRRAPEPAPSKKADRLLATVVNAWTRAFDLSDAEALVLHDIARRPRIERAQLARVQGISEQTIKSHVRALLRRTGAPSTAHLVYCIQREALLLAIGEWP